MTTQQAPSSHRDRRLPPRAAGAADERSRSGSTRTRRIPVSQAQSISAWPTTLDGSRIADAKERDMSRRPDHEAAAQTGADRQHTTITRRDALRLAATALLPQTDPRSKRAKRVIVA